MKLEKSLNRDRKINRRKGGHKVDNKGIFTIVETQKKKALRIKKEREEKEARISGEK